MAGIAEAVGAANGGGPIAVLAGRGAIPRIVAEAAARRGRTPIVFAVAGEADPAEFRMYSTHLLKIGEVGKLFRLMRESGCREVVFIGAIARPDLRRIRPDLGMVKLLPELFQLLRGGDDTVLTGVAAIFEERGIKLVSALDLAPDLALEEGLVTGQIPPGAAVGIDKALAVARTIGGLDIGQGAVAIGDRVALLEDAGGTDAMLDRIPALRAQGRIAAAGGVLVKCVKPRQDRRFDLPTIGPETAERARAAGLDGVAAECGTTMLADRARTIDAFRRAGLFLLGLPAPSEAPPGG